MENLFGFFCFDGFFYRYNEEYRCAEWWRRWDDGSMHLVDTIWMTKSAWDDEEERCSRLEWSKKYALENDTREAELAFD